jgi:hypothetical protein
MVERYSLESSIAQYEAVYEAIATRPEAVSGL